MFKVSTFIIRKQLVKSSHIVDQKCKQRMYGEREREMRTMIFANIGLILRLLSNGRQYVHRKRVIQNYLNDK